MKYWSLGDLFSTVIYILWLLNALPILKKIKEIQIFLNENIKCHVLVSGWISALLCQIHVLHTYRKGHTHGRELEKRYAIIMIKQKVIRLQRA